MIKAILGILTSSASFPAGEAVPLLFNEIEVLKREASHFVK